MLQRFIEWLKLQLRGSESVPTEYLEYVRHVRCAERRRERIYATLYRF